jgi:citrate lyase subunit beta/citryl-CoA lyase
MWNGSYHWHFTETIRIFVKTVIMDNKPGIAGNKGKGISSDAEVVFQAMDKGGPEIQIESKVKALYGNQIRRLTEEILTFFNIQHARVMITDAGALDFVLAARLEAAIKKVFPEKKEQFLLPMLDENLTESKKEAFRFSRLYLPGNSPKLMLNAGIHHPNGLILDLEDAVAPDKKFEARFLVRNALRNLRFYGAERMVRINQGDRGLEDLEYVIPHHVNLVLVPKCESAAELQAVDQKILALRKANNIEHPVWLMPIIESAKGVLKAYEIASATENVVALAIGLEDYTADLGTQRTNEGTESLFARSMVVNACRAAGIQPIDSVFRDVSDTEALAENVKRSKALGFDGMGCIHPRQIKVVHENFAPEEGEIDQAKKICIAFKEAKAKGLGVVSLGSKMIDAPIVKRALKTIDLAIKTGKLDKDWESKETEQ